jgi:ATP-dependent helicase/nuclease subunit A
MTLKDAQQRERAIDPTQSYIVQAPAGSGKTELLTQRFLRLLSLVQAPEQIVALTFTKKAANEMRERILAALELAYAKTEATSPHQLQTLRYANDVLENDQSFNWQLRDQPNRLRIMTIDALCQKIAHAIPLQENDLSFPQISDTPERHYLTAAKACLQFAIQQESTQPAIRLLLKHVDNRQDTLINLFVDLLGQRDQWLQPLYLAKMQDKSVIEGALVSIEQHELARLANGLSSTSWCELIYLSERVAQIENNPKSKRYELRNWKSLTDLTANKAAGLAALLLTTQNTVRKSFDHHVGLKKGACDDVEYASLKSRSQALCLEIGENTDFISALIRVKDLPKPQYHPEQWAVLQALFTILPLLVAHLNLMFTEHNEVDFSAVSQLALHALGDEENPTDLALYLDNTIHHLLVDEFQDTSIQQYQLLSQLVHGWQAGDGRTLFVVGDPMQSIYRFRAAEVGLFLRAQTEGLGNVILTPLQLCCNFRSTEPLIQWVNQQFAMVFPKTSDIESGAVSFHPAVHTKPHEENSVVFAKAYADANSEADGIVDIIQKELARSPEGDIAVLVRSRGQLSAILSRLREHHIPFQGVDIDLLADLPHLRDVWSLTQVLLMPANRLAWLSFLRSPWCGLPLKDLHRLASAMPVASWSLNGCNLSSSGVSDEGQIRVQWVMNVIQHALSRRHQQPLVDWVIQVLNDLHLENVLDGDAQADLEQFWILLERFEQDGQLADFNEFYEQLQSLYSKQVTPSRLQVMTIHKSKGLEFDCVILPGLGKKQASMDKKLLRWLKLPSSANQDLLLISPIKAAHHERCLLYDYIGQLDAQKNEYEMQRLLYVAATRAKKRLVLTDYHPSPARGSFRQLLPMPFISVASQLLTESTHQALPTLLRLPVEFYSQKPLTSSANFNASQLILTDTMPKLLGIILHELLQWICNHHINHMNDVPEALIDLRIRELGIGDPASLEAKQTINRLLNQLFHCPRGQWIIKVHEEAQNEYELLIEANQDIATRIIDRTFIEDGVRWIIDFKTGQDNQNSATQYRQQLNEYAQILSQIDPRPIRCGLYYLHHNHWDEWL